MSYALADARLADRILARVVITSTDCWEWQGACHKAGHGVIGVDGRTRYTHICMWEFMIGPVPHGLILDHLCENPPCCNPIHLEPVTRRINALRGRKNACAQHARKTHCKRKHELTGDNVRIRIVGDGIWRTCLRCRHDYEHERWERMKRERIE